MATKETGGMMQLADLYDGDMALVPGAVQLMRPTARIPHPLIGVSYGDGRIEDTTVGHIWTRVTPARR